MRGGLHESWDRMKVVHLIGGGDTGGVMTHLLPLLQALHERIDLRLICIGDGGLAREAAGCGLRVTVLPVSNAFDTRMLGKITLALGSIRPDIVHTHGSRANIPVRVLRPWLRGPWKLATTIHSDLALDYQTPSRGAAYTVLDMATLPMVDQLVCVSTTLRDRLVTRGYPLAKMPVIRPALAPDPTRPSPAARLWNGRLHIPDLPPQMAALDGEDAVWIGTVARLVAVKDIDLMLEAAARLVLALPEARVAIVGDGPERTRLQRRARDMGLSGSVAFTGRVTSIWPALSRFSAYWLTSISEGLPLSIMEGMATGLPVVATDVGGVAEVLDEGVSGYLIKRDGHGTADRLAAAAASLLLHKEKSCAMGLAGAARVARDFVPDNAARLYLRVYERMMRERSS